MNYAKPQQRISAFWLDSLFMISVFFVFGRIFWNFVPGSEIRADAMQLYTEKDFNNFFVTSAVGFLFLSWYNIYLPISKLRGTLGQKICKISLGQANGEPLKLKTSLLRCSIIFIKYFAVVLTGPLLAQFGDNLATSILGLLLPVLLIIFLSILAWRNSEGVGPIESLCGYRYFTSK